MKWTDYFRTFGDFFKFIRNPRVPKSKKMLVTGLMVVPIIYFIVPIDLLPDVFPVGYLEDGTLLIAAYTLVRKLIHNDANTPPSDTRSSDKEEVIDVEFSSEE